MMATIGVALGLGILMALLTPRMLRALPEPPAPSADPSEHDQPTEPDLDEPGVVPVESGESGESGESKIPYASLATPRFSLVVGGLTALGSIVAGLLLPSSGLPVWLTLSTLGMLLAAIDARTTWLPLPLTRVAWLATALALIIDGVLGSWGDALRGLGGFVLAGALFGLVWLLTRGGFGFGDVRYAPLVGAATASVSWSLLAWALVLGSLVGAVVGLVRLAAGKRSAFAYAPSILAGGYLALLVRWLLA